MAVCAKLFLECVGWRCDWVCVAEEYLEDCDCAADEEVESGEGRLEGGV